MADNLVLPDDMISEIVLRLPEESVLRFKSVSHAWNTKINSRAFVKSYAKLKSKKALICTGGSDSTFYSFSLQSGEEGTLENVPHYFEIPSDYRIAGSCDGLLLLVIPHLLRLRIWNPFTRQYKQLPANNTSSTTFYGIGCANSSMRESYGHSYKVLRIQRKKRALFEVYVYTTHTNSWRRTDDAKYRFCSDSSALVNAKLHFFARKSKRELLIVAFDVANEEFSEVPQPNYGVDCFTSRILMSELNGKLCIVSFKVRMWEKKYVWVMKEYGVEESWTNMFCIDINNLMYQGLACFKVMPLHFDIDGRILLHAYFRVAWDSDSNVRDRKLLIFFNYRSLEERILKLCNFATIYVETLGSPNVVSPNAT